MILPDRELERWGRSGNVYPFNLEQVNPASYDLQFDTEIIDLTTGSELTVQSIEITPGMAILATSVEYIQMPSDCSGVLYLKSSLARQGLDHALAGYVDPGFCGSLTFELHAHRPVTLTAGQRIMQLVLYRLESPPNRTYNGKYQGQTGPTKAR